MPPDERTVAAPDADDHHLVDAIWSGRPPGPHIHQSIDRLVHARAQLDPGLAAVRDSGRSTSYLELSRAAVALAVRLRALGAGPGGVVAVHAPPSTEMIVAALGVMTAGAAYLPLDVTDPPERLRRIVEDAGAGTVVGDTDARWAPPGTVVEPVPTRSLSPPPLPLARLPGPDPNPDRPAYVIYTSGSTGRPKGVVCHHRGIVDLVADFVARRPLPLGSRCSMWTSLGFDVSLYEIFSALLGGTLVIVPDAVRVDTGAVLSMLATEEVASAYLPPFMLPDLADWVSVRPMPHLRRLLVGVEPIPEGLLRELVARIPGLHVINGYGPTETHVCASAYSIDAPSGRAVDPNRRTPIGMPLRHTSLHVLDQDGTPVEEGQIGELYVGGGGVAFGYVGGAGETAARFVADPFFGRPGARMYRTGDQVTRLVDGNLVFHGRGDDQLKVNGYRVEPGEVESGLTRLPAVTSAVAVLRRAAAGKRLEAFVTVRPSPGGATPTGADLRRALRRDLPSHLVPAAVHILPALPTTRNGKLDRAALRSIAESGGPRRSGRGPREGMEEQLIRLAERVLGVTGLGHDVGFLDCGGDSIAALRLASLVRQDLHRRVSMAEVLDCPTFGDLAVMLESRGALDPPAPADPDAAGGDVALTPSQHGLWLLHQIYPDCTAYHVPVLLRLRGNLDREALSGALRDVLIRHPALRTSFPIVDGEPVQRRVAAAEVPASIVRVHEAAPPPREHESFLRGLAQQPFDLAAGPLVRADLVHHGPDDHRLLLVVHHLVTDGWSMEILQRDLWAAYTARVTGRSPDWPAIGADVIAPAAPDTAAEALDYWRRQFADPVPEPVLPERRGATDRTRFHGHRFTREVSEAVARRLERFARRERTSLFSVLIASFGLVVMRYGQTDGVVVGVPTAGRDVPGVEDVVGFFNRTLAVCVDARGEPSVGQYVRRTYRTLADALRHSVVPFEHVVAAVSPRSRSARSPLFRVWCNLLSYPRYRMQATGLAIDAEEPPLPGSLYELCLYVERRDDGLRLTVVHDPDALPTDRMNRLGDHLCHVLAQIAADPDRPLDRLVLEPPAPPPALRPAPIEAEAWTGPSGGGDRPAIRAGSAALSHAEVRSRARDLADALTTAGVGPGSLVGVLTGRTPELGVALLGVRQAGAAFAVLDPSHPVAWLRRSASAAPPTLWLTHPSGRPPHATGDVAGPGPELAGGLACWASDPTLRPCRLPPEAAYVAFTSGTTGRPHAVLGSEEPVLRFVRWYTETFGLTTGDRFAVLAGLGHDPLLRELLLPLVLGATACLPPDAEAAVPGRLLDWIRAERITVLHLTPAVCRLLEAASRDGDAELRDVRLLALGGAQVTPDVGAAARSLCPRARRVSLYGATETPQGVGMVDLDDEFAPDSPAVPPVGNGVCGAQLLVLDGRMWQTAVNEVGEIAVRGRQIALGYLGEPGLTRDRFRADPWGLPGVRVFLTGDRGRRRPDGAVEFLGRLDTQLSINGQRVEPADIEQTARACAGVQECAVVADAADGRPVLYLAPTDTEPAEALQRRVIAHLARVLPATMQPAIVTVVPGIPLTQNGKVDHAALLATAARAAGADPGGDVPDLVPRLLWLWCGLLGQDDISPDTNFFDAGGTSLTLLRLHDLVQAELGRPVELLTFFRFPTVRRLAQALSTGPRPAGRPVKRTRTSDPAGRRERRLELRRIGRDVQAGDLR